MTLDHERRIVRDMLRIICGKFLSQRLRKMRPRDGRKHGPYVVIAKALGHGVTHRDVRFAWTGRKPGSRNALVRIANAVEKLLDTHTNPHLFDRSADAAAMFEGEKEADWPWEEKRLPLSKLAKFRLDAQTVAGDKERFRDIAQWMDASGGPAKALAQSPLIMLDRGNGLELTDGWHRLHLARKRGLKYIPVIIVSVPGHL